MPISLRRQPREKAVLSDADEGLVIVDVVAGAAVYRIPVDATAAPVGLRGAAFYRTSHVHRELRLPVFWRVA